MDSSYLRARTTLIWNKAAWYWSLPIVRAALVMSVAGVTADASGIAIYFALAAGWVLWRRRAFTQIIMICSIGVVAVAVRSSTPLRLPALDQVQRQARIVLGERIAESYDSDGAALMAGMLYGDRSGFSAELRSGMNAAGLSHISAVSGYNLTFVTAWLFTVAGRLPRRLVSWAAIPLLAGYMTIVGWDNLPALRAWVMAMVFLLAQLSGRPAKGMAVLILACGSVLLLIPGAVTSLGFLLSLTAYGGGLLLGSSDGGLLVNILSSMRTTIPVYLVLVIVIGEFPILGVVASLLVVPTVGLITAGGVIGILTSGIKLLSGYFFWVAGLPLELIVLFAKFQARYRLGVVSGQAALILLFTVVILMLFADMYAWKHSNKK